jgi:DNA-binding transcriptional LysR family regulator
MVQCKDDIDRVGAADHPMKLDELRAFVAVAAELHFGRAATSLGSTQPVISRKIRALEDDIGVELFTRTSRRVALTPAGVALLEDATVILDRANHAQRRVREIASGRTGHVRIAAVPGAMAGFVPHVIRSHQREHPQVSLSLHELLAQTQIERLRAGDLDVGFIRGSTPVGDDLIAEPLHQELMGIVVPDTHRLARSRSTTIAALEGERLILPPRQLSSFTYDRIVSACRTSGFEPQIVQEAATASAILGLVSAEVGVAVLAEDFYTLLNEHVRLIPLRDFTVALSMLSRRNPPKAVTTVLAVARTVSATLPSPSPAAHKKQATRATHRAPDRQSTTNGNER